MSNQHNITIVKTEGNIVEDLRSYVNDDKIEIRVFGNIEKINKNMYADIEATRTENSDNRKVCTILANGGFLSKAIRDSLAVSECVAIVKKKKSSFKPGKLVNTICEQVGMKVSKYKVYASGTFLIYMCRKGQ